MKRFLAGLVVGIVIATASVGFATETPIRLFVNGTEITLPDAQPVVIDNRVMVPLMAFSQVAGFNATWVEETRTVLVTTPTAAQQTATAPAQPARALTVTVDGITYYDVDAILNFLTAKYPDRRVAVGANGVVVGTERYKVAFHIVGPWGYLDPTPLLEAEVITPEELSSIASHGR